MGLYAFVALMNLEFVPRADGEAFVAWTLG